MTEWVLVPREPVDAQLTSMALTYDHGYGLRNAFERENIRLHMAQLHRAMLEAAPAAPQQAEPVAWRGINPRTGEEELFWPGIAPSVMRDFKMQPLFLHPPAAEVQRLRAAALALLNELDAGRHGAHEFNELRNAARAAQGGE